MVMVHQDVGNMRNAALWATEEECISEEVENSATVALFQQSDDAVQDAMTHFVL